MKDGWGWSSTNYPPSASETLPSEILCSMSAENLTKDDVNKSADADPSTLDKVSNSILDDASLDSTPVSIRQMTSKGMAAVKDENQRRMNKAPKT